MEFIFGFVLGRLTSNSTLNDKPDQTPTNILDITIKAFAIAFILLFIWASWVIEPYLMHALNKLHIPAIFAQTPFYIFFDLKPISIEDPIHILLLKFFPEIFRITLISMMLMLLPVPLLKYSSLGIRKLCQLAAFLIHRIKIKIS